MQLDALLDVAAASTTAGVVELTVDVAGLDLTDPPTLRMLVAVATTLRASSGRLHLVGMSTDRLLAALQAASLTEVRARGRLEGPRGATPRHPPARRRDPAHRRFHLPTHRRRRRPDRPGSAAGGHAMTTTADVPAMVQARGRATTRPAATYPLVCTDATGGDGSRTCGRRDAV